MKWYNFPGGIRVDLNDYTGGTCPSAIQNAYTANLAEDAWKAARRPIYNLYPSIVEAFTKVDLNKLDCKHVNMPIPQLVVRFPEVDSSIKVRSFLAFSAHSPDGRPGVAIHLDNGSVLDDGTPNLILNATTFVEGQTIGERLQHGFDNPYYTPTTPETEIPEDDVTIALRILVTLCLLKDNPDLIEPMPLEADRAKWEASHDPKLLDKAMRRGKREWAIGRHIDIMPGFRHPHFAIRWCGPGGHDPQVRPIKGCLVRKEQIRKVPTEYLDEPRTLS